VADIVRSPLAGTKTLLFGDIGTGKTRAIETLVAAGIKPLAIFTEQGYGVLGDALKEKVSWVYVRPITGSLVDLRKQIEAIGTKGQSELGKEHDRERFVNSPLDQIGRSMERFVDQNGRDWGNIGDWGTGVALVLDSISGLTRAIWQNTTGRRALLDKPDYMLAQTQLENFLAVFCALRCHVVVTAHAEKEIDPLNGGMRITPVLPGKALAGKVGRDFDEVLLARRVKGTNFDWTNVEEGALGKKRYLPYAAGQTPTFVPLIEAWRKAGGVVESIGDNK
jgi:hypothetical protein